MQKALENLTREQLFALLEKEGERRAMVEKIVSIKDQKISELEFQLAQYKRIVHGQKRERFEGDKNQMSLPFEADAEKVQEQQERVREKLSFERRKRKSAHQGRMPLPDHLDVVEIEIYPKEDITDMVCIGKETTDELEYEPAKFYIKRYIRYKYAPKNREGVFIGELPNRVIEKGIAGPGLLTSVLVDKYVDHLPLYRQGQRFKRAKIPIAPSTLEGWARQGLELIDILYG